MSIDTSTRLAELYGSPLVGDGSISNPLRSSKGRQVPFSLHQVEYDFEEGEPKMVRIKTDSPELFQHSKAQKLKLTAPEKTSDPRHHAIQFLYIGASAQKGFDFTNMWLFIHDDLFRSTVIQGFVFENLDPEFFEPVDLSPWSKIYRVNR